LKYFLPPFLLGFIALSFQIFLLREFSVHFYGNEITFGLILAAWLLWGGVGSISASKWKFNLTKLPHVYYGIVFLFPLCLIGLRFSRYFLKVLPGEITGIIPMLIFSFALSFLISTPLGMLFVFNTHFQKGNLSRVYFLESLGAATAGLIVYFLLIPIFSNWQGASIVGALASLLIFFTSGKRKQTIFLISVFIFLGAFYIFDFPSQKLYWKPFNLIKSKDSPYGKLQLLKTQEQVSLYNNSFLVYSYPDIASSEESVHFALLQNPSAERVLLVGGGAGGGLAEVLKYPRVEVDYVELDPEIIRFSLQFLPREEQQLLKNKRIHIVNRDGRAFLSKSQKKYDVIISNLPEPATAQINRFYTKEFFLIVREKLDTHGVFSFRVPSAENYISLELQSFLSSLYHTLKEVFSFIQVVPGDTNIFLASALPVSIQNEELSQKIENLNLQTSYMTPHLLFSRLNPLRIDLLKEKVSTGEKTINRDFSPISYFYNSVLWSTQFKGLERNIFYFFAKIHSFWLLDLPLLLFVSLLTVLWRRGKKSTFFLIPLAVMGFTSIVAEIIVIIAFQSLYGYLYQRIALLLASFMAGLALGSFRGKRRKKYNFGQLLFIQLGFIIILSLFYLSLKTYPLEIVFFSFLLILGFLGGDLFIVSNHLFLKEKKNYGVGYGLDLLGSFFGALATSSILIPLVGLPLVSRYLILINSFCFLFLLAGWRKL
jgi:spermidine synthase